MIIKIKKNGVSILKLAIIASLVIVISGCNNPIKLNQAQENADFIIANLGKENVKNQFPSKYFPVDNLQGFLNFIQQKCDWENRDGKFVDFYSSNNNGINEVAFIYEYYLNCDSVRLILNYNVSETKPMLTNLVIQPIETECKLIIDPKKQLQYRIR